MKACFQIAECSYFLQRYNVFLRITKKMVENVVLGDE